MRLSKVESLRMRVGGHILASGICSKELRVARTLTRGEAVEMVWEAHGDQAPRLALLKLRDHWAASEKDVPVHCGETEMAEWLTEFVDGCCVSDDVRSNGPGDDDDTGLLEP